MAFDVGSVIAHIKADIGDFKKGISDAKSEMGLFGSHISGVANNIQNAFKLAAAATTAAGVAATGILTKHALEAAASFEQQEIAFTTLLKDRGKAIKAIKAIEEEAKKTPYNLPDLIKANQLLISAGVNTEDARDQIRALGNAIAATGGGTAELNRLAVNLQQIKSLGKATALDIRQFAFAGINIYSLLADVTGKNVDQVREMDVSYELLTKALQSASEEGGRFEGAMINQVKSFQGLKSNLEDVVGITLKDIAVQSGLFDATKQVTAQMIAWVTDAGPVIIQFIKDLGEKIGQLTKFLKDHEEQIKIAATVITAIFAPALVALAFQMAFNATMAVVNFTAAIAMFVIEGWKAIGMLIIKTLQLGLATAAFILHTAVTIAQTTATIAVTAATWLLNAALVVLTSPIFLVIAAIVALIAIGYLLIKNWDKVKETGKAMLDYLTNAWNSFVGFLKNVGGKILDAIVSPFADAWNRIKDFVNKIKDALDFTKRHSPSVVDLVNRGVHLVNRALSGLEFAPNINPQGIAAGIGVGTGPGLNNITINLNDAVITDEFTAQRLGEKIGDGIIKKLQLNLRF